MVSTTARLLPPPTVNFANATAKPLTSGRWDLREKKFLLPNPVALVHWGVFVFVPDRGTVIGVEKVQNWVSNFCTVYGRHGGKITNKQPHIGYHSDVAKGLEELHKLVNQKAGKNACQMILVVLPDRGAFTYKRVKKNLDCRWGVVSQCKAPFPLTAGWVHDEDQLLTSSSRRLGQSGLEMCSAVHVECGHEVQR
jgi:eukaryotic translation initiation factor 2C